MSRIGKLPIAVPEKTNVLVEDNRVRVTGPNGELVRIFKPEVVTIEVREGIVIVMPKSETQEAKALWGTYASHIINMVAGVNQPFVKKLVVEGIGYKVDVSGNEVVLLVGFSHPVKLAIPHGITVAVEKNVLTISGADKELVGAFAANIRAVKKPEPYKGKGIRYENEVVKRKQGKRATA